MKRRAWLAGMASTALVRPGLAQRRPGDRALALGMERLLVDAGFGAAAARRFGRDTGLALQVEPGPSSALLQALARGEVDLAITHAPALAARLEADGTIYAAHALAHTDFLLVGPRTAPALAVEHDASGPLTRIAQSKSPFLTRNDGSGTHLAEQALWRAVGIAPEAPWYRPMDPAGGPLLVQARETGAACLVDRATWLAPASRGAARGLAVLAEGDPRLATVLRLHRSLLSPHPATALVVGWLAGPAGRALVRRTPGLRAPT